jgi:DNA-binding PadR family transcriptional regulator
VPGGPCLGVSVGLVSVGLVGQPTRSEGRPVGRSKAETLVLAMLAEEPMYGYEILERLRERGGAEWAGVSRASVYQALRRLERAGHATAHSVAGLEGPDRRTYRLTRAGRSRLRAALLAGFDVTGPYEVEASVPIAFSHLLDAAEVRVAVARREATVRERRSHLAQERKRIRSSDARGSAQAVRLLEQQVAFAEAELATLAAVRRDLARSPR